jgi:hypothetical protein
MKVVGYREAGWFLIENKDKLLLDVNCSYSFVSFGMIIELNSAEEALYKLKGESYINELADDVQFHALGKYQARNLDGEYSSVIHPIIVEFLNNLK